MNTLQPQDISILSGQRGISIQDIVGPYLQGAKSLRLEDPYIRQPYQIQNFLRLCECAVLAQTIGKITLITHIDYGEPKFVFSDWHERMELLRQSLLVNEIELEIKWENPELHDRRIGLDNGWEIILGRGLDFYQPVGFFELGAFVNLAPLMNGSDHASRWRSASKSV